MPCSFIWVAPMCAALLLLWTLTITTQTPKKLGRSSWSCKPAAGLWLGYASAAQTPPKRGEAAFICCAACSRNTPAEELRCEAVEDPLCVYSSLCSLFFFLYYILFPFFITILCVLYFLLIIFFMFFHLSESHLIGTLMCCRKNFATAIAIILFDI